MLNKRTIGAVVIGRNEGIYLHSCLTSLKLNPNFIIYVDSGSTDNSIDIAKSLGIKSVQLDLSLPFTAARARNIGVTLLLELHSNLNYVQFVDGDCELKDDWIANAFQFMENNPDYAIVFGRRRERFPLGSIFNQLCDIEWNTPVGDSSTCGGDAFIRVTALKQVQGYREDLIAGEEPEMCFRLRTAGWKIWRLDRDITMHDANITHFRQWWRRTQRCGYAFAEVCYLHGRSNEKMWVRECLRIILWGLLIPFFVLILIFINPFFLLLLIAYPLQMFKIAMNTRAEWQIRLGYGFFTVLGKFAEATGLLNFWYAKLKGYSNTIIEYK